MIRLENVSKLIRLHGKRRAVLCDVNLDLPADRRIALLGSSLNDRQILMRMLAGIVLPTRGHIARQARVSFPVGYLGGFSADLSVRQNIAHVARLYGADVATVLAFIERVSNFGPLFDKVFRDIPGPLKNQLGVIVAYSIPFDVYLLGRDFGQPKHGVVEFYEITKALFSARMKEAGSIVVTVNPRFAREHCDMGLVLHRGQLVLIEDIERAITIAQQLPRDDNEHRAHELSGRREQTLETAG